VATRGRGMAADGSDGAHTSGPLITGSAVSRTTQGCKCYRLLRLYSAFCAFPAHDAMALLVD
jgi:hypothetical protein